PGSDHANMRDYWRGLLALRMSEYGQVFRVADVPQGHYRWITPDDPRLLGYVVGERVLVLANNGAQDGVFRFDLPRGPWKHVGDGERVDLNGVGGAYARLDRGTREVRVPAGSFLVWVAEP
ncbi:MAG: pullulanase, partial [Gemmatimonadota bacterium]|nr:pullulanase [Gemmatimonadota bacterium]